MKKRFVKLMAVMLAAAVLCAVPVSASEQTMTVKTVYKDIGANTEIYAVSDTAGADYKYYGAKWEPKGGAYFGRTLQGGAVSGGWGVVNSQQLSNESAVSFYYELNDPYTLEYWSYLYGKVIQDGKHALLVNLNYTAEGDDCSRILSGTYDTKLVQAFTYLGTLSCPVFVRIGGEMNVWTKMPTTSGFISSYQHIAKLARQYAPNAALVFSPNFSGSYKVDMDSFYPGDAYVDWIGTSLYYNKYATNGDTKNDAFYGVGQYGDALLNIQQTVNLSNLHRKPVIVTEGGSAYKCVNKDASAFAAERVQRAYSFLTMVYPQVKCLIYSDTNFGGTANQYALHNNASMTAAYDKGVQSNPTLRRNCNEAASYYTKLSSYPKTWSGTVQLRAYTYSSDKPVANWYIDGKWAGTAADYPYAFSVNADTLAAGNHTVTVKFSNGASKSYSFQANAVTANPTNNPLFVDGVQKQLSVYKIDGSNYFKLRDIAALLSGSEKQFSVDYDNSVKSVTVASGKSYTPDGSELKPASSTGSVTASKSSNSIYINGKKMDLSVYKINGNNYFKLRDLGAALDFYVGYDNAAKSVTISGKSGYQAD